MIKAIKTLIVCSLPFMAASQIEYNLDTSAFEIIEGVDTLLATDKNRNLYSQTSLQIESPGSDGKIRLRAFDNPRLVLSDQNNDNTIEFFTRFNGSGGALLLSDPANGDTNSIRLVTNYGSTNDARIITDELQINGGADLAEMFDINGEEVIKPGLLVSIDPNDPGKLKITTKAYDEKMAGVIAGANGIKPGILMGQNGTVAHGEHMVTLNGRTYLRANTNGGKIKPGDWLTSSQVPGEAMRVKNKRKAQGSIIGKAMSPLSSGSDYILVLVNLQ